MEAMLGIRFLASEYPTGPWHRGRIDTLGLDENGAPVVVEYTKTVDSGGLSQASSYLSWLCSARHEFEALVRKRPGSGAVEEIDWRNARAVCIAGDSSRHDRVAVYDNRRRIDLVRYRVFDGGLLNLMLVESSPASAGPGPAQQRNRGATGAGDRLRAVPNVVPDGLRDLYGELDEALNAWGEVEVARLRHYIAYRRMVNRASVLFRPSYGIILVHLSLDPDTVVLEEGFSRDMRGIGHLASAFRLRWCPDLGRERESAF